MSKDKEKITTLQEKILAASEKLNNYIQGNGNSKKLKVKCQYNFEEIKKLVK